MPSGENEICAGPDAHPDPRRRYVAGVACGVFYCVAGVFGATTAALFAGLPPQFVACLAAIALLAPLLGGLNTAMRDEQARSAAAVTFLRSCSVVRPDASGMTLLGVGSAFWGLLFGVAVLFVTAPGKLATVRRSAAPSPPG